MHAMILAAGRGNRLRPLTDTCPKPLIKVRGKALIEYHLEALSAIGVKNVVINIAYLGAQIQAALGTGERWGVQIAYSAENPVLEVGGGILQALPLLGENPFIVINSDIWTDYPLQNLLARSLDEKTLAHLVLIENPDHNHLGDFGLQANRVIDVKQYTYAGIGLYKPELFNGCEPGVFPLAPVLRSAIANNALTGEYYAGRWSDIGTPARLQQAQSDRVETAR